MEEVREGREWETGKKKSERMSVNRRKKRERTHRFPSKEREKNSKKEGNRIEREREMKDMLHNNKRLKEVLSRELFA